MVQKTQKTIDKKSPNQVETKEKKPKLVDIPKEVAIRELNVFVKKIF